MQEWGEWRIMKLTNGKDTVVLDNEIQIRAYLSSGYAEVEEKTKKKG